MIENEFQSQKYINYPMIMRDVSAPIDLADLLQWITRWAVDLLKADAGQIFLWDQSNGNLFIPTSYGFRDGVYAKASIKPGEGVAGQVFLTGEPMIIKDYHRWEGKLDIFDYPPATSSVLGVPMICQQQTVGVLIIDSNPNERIFSQDDVHLATILANLGAVAIRNMTLFQDLRLRSEQLNTILKKQVEQRTAELAHRALQLETSARVSREITSILDIDELLAMVVDLIDQTFGYYCVQIFLVEPVTNRFKLRASSRKTNKVSGRETLPEFVPDELNRRVIESSHHLLVDDVKRDRRYPAFTQVKSVESELIVPLIVGKRVIGTMAVAGDKPGAFGQDDVTVIQSLGDQVAIAIENARLYEESREMAVMEERHRMARELHDSVTQALFSIDLHARAIATNLRRDQNKAEDQISHLRLVTHDTLQEMRSLIYDLRPSHLEEYGLVGALREEIDRFKNPGGPTFKLDVRDDRRLPAEVERGLFRIIQEAIRNAIKHAGANLIVVELLFDPQSVAICISDDGRGFDPAALPNNRRAFGLIGMQERAELLKCVFSIDSKPGNGSRVRVYLPL
ncbi:MAG: GAF domain-containing sensor histidine kinase [Anaerolineales bacterium]|nr:GAF domain-containing sensor histidine kinase [Anaerolineales bacterium]